MNNPAATMCEWTLLSAFPLSENIAMSIVHYAHLIPAAAVVIIVFFVFWHNPRSRPQQALFALGIVFSIWVILQLLSVVTHSEQVLWFAASSNIHFELLMYLCAFIFAHTYINNAWPPSWVYAVSFLLFIPLFLFSHTPLNVASISPESCWPHTVQRGLLWLYYVYPVQIILFILFIKKCITAYQVEEKATALNRYMVTSISIGLLLIIVSSAHWIRLFDGEYFWSILALFTVPILFIVTIFQVIDYNNRNSKALATEAVLFAIGMLLLSLLFLRDMTDVAIIATVSFVMLLLLGLLFVNFIRHELHQEHEIEKLLEGLSRANRALSSMDKQKSEFVSIASHQLRSPLTAIRGYASMLLEGSFSSFPAKARKPLEHIEESARMMAMSIEDYLNVSRIESGNMKYDLEDFNLPEIASNICDDLRAEATKKGLLLLYKSDIDHQGIVHADKGKVQQIIHNLINNSLKYTPKGTITVYVHDDSKKQLIHVEVIDTGIGMDEETQNAIFQKFQRSKNAHTVNVHGTGLGLFVAKKMANDMGGDVTAYSDGEGKGSHFILHLPLKL